MLVEKKGNDQYKHSLAMLTFIVLLFFFGALEIILGALVSAVVSNGAGSWWTGAMCAIVACLIYYRGIPSKITVAFGLSCLVIAIAGAAVDGNEYFVARELVTCASNLAAYGDTSSSNSFAVFACRNADPQYDCSCVTNDLDICYSYNLVVDQEYCEQILTDFPEALERSYLCCLLIAIFSFIFSIFLCNEGCDWEKTRDSPGHETEFNREMTSPTRRASNNANPTRHFVSPLMQQQQKRQQSSSNMV